MTDTVTGRSVFYSGDTRFDYPAYAPMLSRADRIFHDCQLVQQTAPIHALISELRTMPDDVKKKTLLYHYEDTFDAGPYSYVAEEFAGFAQPRHRYVLFD